MYWPSNIATNDVAGNFSLTLIDVLDTLVVLNDVPRFESAVRDVIDWVSFDVNTKPQVFETTIRVLGGLLSGHIFAAQPNQPFYLPWYKGELLQLALDLGERLLPAFATATGIPFARVNLRHGVVHGETFETCTAGAGSLILEFATLSRLTGDDRFERAAYKAFFALWNRKSEIGLVGNTINTNTGTWTHPEVTGIGAGVDSFYEYALKWYILSGEVEFLDVWNDSYAALMRYSRAVDGYWFRNVNIHTGDTSYFTVDSLSAFWPGLQVLAGDVHNAVKSHMMYWNLWRIHSGLPEVYDTNYKTATSHQYPLRPELAESTWYLYRATKDPFYLDVGERILEDFEQRAKVDCGLTGIADLRTNKRDDRMESFALSETLKACPHLSKSGLATGIRSRSDLDYSRELVALYPDILDQEAWSVDGYCERPRVETYSFDFVLSADGQAVPEDPSPSVRKLQPVAGGYVVHNITGLRTHIVRRMDGKGYDITKLGPHAVKTGQVVYVNDTALFSSPPIQPTSKDSLPNPPEVHLRFFLDLSEPSIRASLMDSMKNLDVVLPAWTSSFGANLSSDQAMPDSVQFAHGDGVPLDHERSNQFGCEPYSRNFGGAALVLKRGECTFLEKLVRAKAAGASGVLVISDIEQPLNPSADKDELEEAGDIGDVALVVLSPQAGIIIDGIIAITESKGLGRLMVTLVPEGQPASGKQGKIPPELPSPTEQSKKRILYLNGHALVNTQLL
ncbi:hypothetical protein ONZ45_g68 [Pleurotus djamor]|nr:hypothetical protein ONZ45_g68 [Pleurotus djamor]